MTLPQREQPTEQEEPSEPSDQNLRLHSSTLQTQADQPIRRYLAAKVLGQLNAFSQRSAAAR